MKMKAKHYDRLRKLILEAKGLTSAQEKLHPNWSSERYRWNCLWNIPNEERQPLMQNLYSYLNDNHIDTALRRIFKHKR